MKKIIALALSVMMLFGCIASAQTMTFQADLSVMGSELLNGILTLGNDEDGCYSASVNANVQGQMISALTQIGANAVTAAVNGQAITVTADAVSEAVLGVITKYVPASVINYVMNAQYEQDMMMVMQIATAELNRIAGIAMGLGLVTISENGDLTVDADIEGVYNLLYAYLTDVANDAGVINALTSLNIWNALELPDAATVQHVIVMLAENVADQISYLGYSRTTASLYLNVSAAGAASLEIVYDDGYTGFSVSAASDGLNTTATATVKDWGAVSTCTVTTTANGVVTVVVDTDNGYGTETAHVVCVCDGYSLSVEGNALDYGETTTFSCTASANGLVIDAVSVYGERETLNLKVNASAQGVFMNYTDGYEFVNFEEYMDAQGALHYSMEQGSSYDSTKIAYVLDMPNSLLTVNYADRNYTVEAALDLMGFELTGSVTNWWDEVITFTGAPVVTENSIAYNVVFDDDGETHVLSIGGELTEITENGMILTGCLAMDDMVYTAILTIEGTSASLSVFAGEEMLGNVAAVLSMNDTSAQLALFVNGTEMLNIGGEIAAITENGMTVNGYVSAMGQTYSVSVAIEGTDAAVALYVNGYEVLNVTCGIRASATADGECVQLYVVYEDIEYVLTAVVGENCVSVSLDAYMGEQAQNICAGNFAVSYSGESFAHVEGEAVSAEQIMGLIEMLIG